MKNPKFIPEFKDIPTSRQKMPELPLEERKLNFNEVELGFSEEMARKEASRCLSCRRCIGCGLCLAECDPQAIIYDEKEEEVVLQADAVIVAEEGVRADVSRKKELGYRDCSNVITGLEFERLVSPTGPFGGLLVRPSDGDLPRKIAFVQCVGSRDEYAGANYCSTYCCSRTLTQIERARQILGGDFTATVFHKGMRPFGKEGEIALRELSGKKWAKFINATVTSISEDRTSGEVTVRYEEDGKEKEEKFDLVVLATGIAPTKDYKRYARKAGWDANQFGFVNSDFQHLLGKPSQVLFAGEPFGPTICAQSLRDAIAAVGMLGVEFTPPQAKGKAAGERVVFCVCEYGLRLSGKTIEDIPTDGIQIEITAPFLCYQKGREEIARRMENAKGIVVIGCHGGTHEEMFEAMFNLPPGSVQIVSVTNGRIDAEDLRSAVERIGVAERLPRKIEKFSVAVVGGGIAGLAAAREIARKGGEVFVIEKTDTIGGYLNQIGSDEETANAIQSFKEEILNAPPIKVLTNSSVKSLSRQDQRFRLCIDSAGSEKTLDVDIVLLATGARETSVDTYPLGRNEKVMSQRAFEQAILEGKNLGKRIVMIQCVGGRDNKHRYCSFYCCEQAIRNALQYKQVKDGVEVTILHRGIRVFGFGEALYTQAQEKGITFLEVAEQPEITQSGSALKVTYKAADGAQSEISCDKVVLSLAHSMEEMQEVAKTIGVEVGEHGFFETPDPVLHPFNTTQAGIFVCGFARTPMNPQQAFIDGVAAASAIEAYLLKGS